jgi:hypothetical protein
MTIMDNSAVNKKRVFILGAGFSKPAGMPLATELLPPILRKLEVEPDDELRGWLDHLSGRLAWLSRDNCECASFKINIEQVFHYTHFVSA